MHPTDAGGRLRTPRAVAAVVALLLAVRFSANTILAGFNLTTATLAVAGQVLEAYDLLLPVPLFAVLLVLLRQMQPPVPGSLVFTILILHVGTFATWGLGLISVGNPYATDLFIVLAVVAVGSVSILAHSLLREPRGSARDWSRWAHLGIVAAVPLVLAMRIASVEGLEAAPGPGGSLEPNWLFANLPTVLLEVLMITIWAEVVLSPRMLQMRARWYAFLPFVFVPLVILASLEAPLSGYVLSTFVSWGANLVLFAPAPYSLGLAAAALACYASTLLLLDRRGNKEAWDLLVLGSLSIVLAGFYPSMASVVGLSVALVLTTHALIIWKEPPARPDLREAGRKA